MNCKPWGWGLGIAILAVLLVVVFAIAVANSTGLSDDRTAANGTDRTAPASPTSTMTPSTPSSLTTSPPFPTTPSPSLTPTTTAPSSAPVPETTAPTNTRTDPTVQASPPANTIDDVGLTYCGWQDTESGTLIATGDGDAPMWSPGGDPGLQIGQTHHFVRSDSNTRIIAGVDRVADSPGTACPTYFATAEWHNG